ncbi:MAG: hypothetical protein Q4E01_03040 [Actinomycetaceae bacterium]|nr:hypothetical protein [Actinomycetaceae bacterium]
MNDPNIDEEFQRIVAGMEDPDLLKEAQEPAPQADEASEDSAEEPDLDTPVDESLHLQDGKQCVGLIFAPLRPAAAVSRMLGMYKIARWVVPIDNQVVLYLELESPEGEEFAELLGEERPMPEEVDRFARVLSKLSKFGAVAVVSTLAEEDSLVAGSVYARRYVNGEPEDSIPAGLLINSIDIRAEDLLLGRTHPEDYPDAVHGEERPNPKGRGFRFPGRS